MKNCQKLALIVLCFLCTACAQDPFDRAYSGDMTESWQMATYESENNTVASSGSRAFTDVGFVFSDNNSDYVVLNFQDVSLKLEKSKDGKSAKCDGEEITRRIEKRDIKLNTSADLVFQRSGGFSLDLTANGVEDSPSISYSISVDTKQLANDTSE